MVTVDDKFWHTDMKKFDEASKVMGGRFKVTTVIQRRMRDIINAGLLKEFNFHTENMMDKILDEIIAKQILVKKSSLTCATEEKEK